MRGTSITRDTARELTSRDTARELTSRDTARELTSRDTARELTSRDAARGDHAHEVHGHPHPHPHASQFLRAHRAAPRLLLSPARHCTHGPTPRPAARDWQLWGGLVPEPLCPEGIVPRRQPRGLQAHMACSASLARLRSATCAPAHMPDRKAGVRMPPMGHSFSPTCRSWQKVCFTP